MDLHHDQYHSHHFFQSLSKIGHHTHTRFMHRYLACSCTDSLSPVISPCDILQKWVIELANQDESGVREEIADRGNVDTAVDEPLDTMPTGRSEGNLRDIKEESSCEEKDGEVSEEVTLAKKIH